MGDARGNSESDPTPIRKHAPRGPFNDNGCAALMGHFFLLGWTDR